MNSELFEVPESLSPKLKWMRAHGLVTEFDEELVHMPESPETGETCYPWVCYSCVDDMAYGFGESEEDAIADACSRLGLVHYSFK